LRTFRRPRRRLICPSQPSPWSGYVHPSSAHFLSLRWRGSDYGARDHPDRERRPTWRDALNHLFGIAPACGRRHETRIRRTPPFIRTMVDDGITIRVRRGVVFRVVTSTGPGSTNRFMLD